MQSNAGKPLSFTDHQYDELINEAVAYLKGGDRERARRLLENAVLIGRYDARALVWLSATTDDPKEQRGYLERAVALEPSNAAARRGLVMLSEKMKNEQVLEEGKGFSPDQSPEPQSAQASAFICHRCGGRLEYDVQVQGLKCTYCGSVQRQEQSAGAAHQEQALDFVLPTERAHRWADAQQQAACEVCGALSLLPPTQAADRCPYCGSNRLIHSGQRAGLVDPQAIGVAKLDEPAVLRRVRAYLEAGWFTPDDLGERSANLSLRPAYYPYWIFDGTLELPWVCEVNEGSNRSPRWVVREGLHTHLFHDILTPGLKMMAKAQFNQISPFLLKELVPFEPEYLAGWPALSYDIPLAEAALNARQQVVQRARRELGSKIAPGNSMRNLNSSGARWSGLTFKCLLLPVWVGGYQFQGRGYALMVNGQTGKVSGAKPQDDLKLVMVVAAAVLTLVALVALAYQVLAWLL